jgi:hypothetical protein
MAIGGSYIYGGNKTLNTIFVSMHVNSFPFIAHSLHHKSVRMQHAAGNRFLHSIPNCIISYTV